MKSTRVILMAICLLVSCSAFAQGPLEPSGPPGPTMKTLDQVEPRIPISTPSTISQPGSYFLTQNFTGSIGIVADDVSLDLNGFTVMREDNSTVLPVGNVFNVRIFNGTVKGGSYGVLADGSEMLSISNVRFIGSKVASIQAVGTGGLIDIVNVQIEDAESTGIRVGADDDSNVNVRIVNSTVSNGNTSEVFTRSAISIYHSGSGKLDAVVTNNRVISNRTTGIVVSASGSGDSIGVVSDNGAYGNGFTGIIVTGDFIVVRNEAQGNGTNYDLSAAPNAAPVKGVAESPGPWDNISE